nr:DUF6402 family protein [Ralstonia mannitolilytica]
MTQSRQLDSRADTSKVEHIVTTPDEKPLFLERSILFQPWWVPSKGACTAVDAEEFSLSMERPAPPLRDQPPPPPPPRKPTEPKRPPKSAIEAFLDFKEWLHTPPPPKPPKTAVTPEIKKPRVTPFDIQQIPDAMDRIGWSMSAKLQRKWFAGELNYITSDKGEALSVNQDGKPFPPDMIDTTMFKLDWILKFDRAKIKYEDLTKNKIFTKKARSVIVDMVRATQPSPYTVDPWGLCGESIHEFHKRWQYQFISVDSSGGEKFAMLFRGFNGKAADSWMTCMARLEHLRSTSRLASTAIQHTPIAIIGSSVGSKSMRSAHICATFLRFTIVRPNRGVNI